MDAKSSQHKVKQQYIMLLLTVLSALALGVGAFTYFLLAQLSALASQPHSMKTVSAVLRQLEASSKMAHFSEHEDYKNLNHEFDAFWSEKLLTPNGGFFIADKETNNTNYLGVSMFHQLHCLAMIRGEMQHLHEVIDASQVASPHVNIHGQPDHGPEIDGGRPAHHNEIHAMHCFDYLRQSLLCLADATIELPKQFPDGEPHIDGMGQRECKNWEILYSASTKSDSKPLLTEKLL